MQVQDVMTRRVDAIESSSSVADAASVMRDRDIGFLPVRDGKKITGVISDRDIVLRCVAEHGDCSSVRVDEVMTRHPAFCHSDDLIEDAVRVMEQRQIHRLLVVDSDNHPVGVLSTGDLAARCDDEKLAGEALREIDKQLRLAS